MGADRRDAKSIPALVLLYVLWDGDDGPLSCLAVLSYTKATHLDLETVRSVKYPSEEMSSSLRAGGLQAIAGASRRVKYRSLINGTVWY